MRITLEVEMVIEDGWWVQSFEVGADIDPETAETRGLYVEGMKLRNFNAALAAAPNETKEFAITSDHPKAWVRALHAEAVRTLADPYYQERLLDRMQECDVSRDVQATDRTAEWLGGKHDVPAV